MKADKQAFQRPVQPYQRHSLAAVNATQDKIALARKNRALRARLGITLRRDAQ